MNRQDFLYQYCVTLYEKRDYQSTLDCINRTLESVSLNGDPEPRLWNTNIVGIKSHPKIGSIGIEYPLLSRAYALRAEVLMDFGDFDGALRSFQKSADLYSTMKRVSFGGWGVEFPPFLLPNISGTTEYFNPEYPQQDLGMGTQFERRATLAIAHLLNGQAAMSNALIDEISRKSSEIKYLLNKRFLAVSRSSLVRLYMATRQYDKAFDILSSDSYVAANAISASLGVLGMLSLVSGNVFQADVIPKIADNLAIDPHNIRSKFQLSHAAIELGREELAKPALGEILATEGIKSFAGIYWAALYDRGRISEHEDQFEEAIKYYRTAIDEIERQRSTINTDGAKIGFFGDKQAVYQALVRLLFKTGKYEEAFLIGERSKSRALVDMLANKQDFHIANADATKINHLLSQSQIGEMALARNTTADTELANRLSKRSTGREGAEQVDVRVVLDEVRNLKVSAKDQLTAQAPQLASLISVPQVNLIDIQQKPPTDQAIVSYYYDAENLYAFVIDGKSLKATRLDRTGLEDDIQAFRQAIATRDQSYRQTGQILYKRLIAPLAGQLHYPKLLIAGHGALHYLPFAALTDGESFLLDRYEISVLPSASTLKFVGNIKASAKPGTVLAFGNPDLGDKQFNLGFAEKEAKDVAGLFEKSALFLGKEASKKNFKAYGQGFRYLHFATHGKLDPAHPLDSALMLSTPSVANKQDRLTIGELYSMRLDADLVTLSACETGLGKIANGDDVVGLVRGFLYAGANQIVSTLWEIDDEATSTLMTDFYTNIKVGISKAEALRRSQQAIRQQYPNPFFWAAFQITGGAG